MKLSAASALDVFRASRCSHSVVRRRNLFNNPRGSFSTDMVKMSPLRYGMTYVSEIVNGLSFGCVVGFTL
jgi:hypothetical protein